MLTRWDEYERSFLGLDEVRRRLGRMFEEVGLGYGRLPAEAAMPPARNFPAASLYDEGNRLVIYAEIPGLSDKDIEVTLNQDVLTLSGERKVEAPKGYSVHRQERDNIKFARSFSLPCKIDPEKVSASVKDGQLTVGMEKAAEAKPRQITVKAS